MKIVCVIIVSVLFLYALMFYWLSAFPREMPEEMAKKYYSEGHCLQAIQCSMEVLLEAGENIDPWLSSGLKYPRLNGAIDSQLVTAGILENVVSLEKMTKGYVDLRLYQPIEYVKNPILYTVRKDPRVIANNPNREWAKYIALDWDLCHQIFSNKPAEGSELGSVPFILSRGEGSGSLVACAWGGKLIRIKTVAGLNLDNNPNRTVSNNGEQMVYRALYKKDDILTWGDQGDGQLDIWMR